MEKYRNFLKNTLFFCVCNYNLFEQQKLEEDLKSDLGGKFEDAVLALIEARDEFEAKMLKKAIKVEYIQLKLSNMNFYLLNSKGPGTDEKALIRILCAKESKEIETLKAAYKRRNIKINFKII